MFDSNNQRQLQLLSLISKCHGLLNIAWPRPGVPQMAGASIFINTNLFRALENGLSQIEEYLDSDDCPAGPQLIAFWKCFGHLFRVLNKQERNERSLRIDEALNLLYLASGILYHRMEEISSVTLEADPRLKEVEDIPTLITICKWTGSTTPAEMDCEIIKQMNAATSQFGE